MADRLDLWVSKRHVSLRRGVFRGVDVGFRLAQDP